MAIYKSGAELRLHIEALTAGEKSRFGLCLDCKLLKGSEPLMDGGGNKLNIGTNIA